MYALFIVHHLALLEQTLDLSTNAHTLPSTFKLVQLWLSKAFPAKNVRLEPPGQILACLVLHVSARGHGKDVVEFLKLNDRQ